MLKEQILSIDSFNNPKILEDTDAIATVLIRLILLDPGLIQSHPNMGVGITSRWRYCDEEDLYKLEEEIYKQITDYLPLLLIHRVTVYYDKKYLIIQVNLEKGVYIFGTNDFNVVKLIDIL